uniref:Uncharacterized protein n=1 Tax=Anguilla anguilla TaxID=7936 RepID=A0A0E9SQI1_ANGAN
MVSKNTHVSLGILSFHVTWYCANYVTNSVIKIG